MPEAKKMQKESEKKQLVREEKTLKQMIELYCRSKEGNATLCPECVALLGYAQERLAKCPFGATKTSCQRCAVHCYKPQMREKIRQVMRYAGPRMIFYHPLAALRHIFTR